mmetsp:Transcript_2243/g.5058  ORF Transcript_2243/g.5058 Transcript_2243/m.5058 type:complete len:276 (-) Transcript_2243:301-1128(-)
MDRARTCQARCTPGTSLAIECTDCVATRSDVSESCITASMPMRTPIVVTMPATTSPASGSRIGTPSIAPPTPARATTEESASDRWCHALAISIGELICSPMRSVARNRNSFDTIEASAATKAILPSGAGDGCIISEYAFAPNEQPASSSRPAMAREPSDSKRPWPYGWSSSGGSCDMLRVMSVSASEMRSEKEWPASDIMAAEWPTTPAKTLKIARARLTAAPSHVMRAASPLAYDAFSWDAARLSAFRPPKCLRVVDQKRMLFSTMGRTTSLPM